MDLRGAFDQTLGMWIRVSASPYPTPQPVLFLDRDGVVVEETEYLCRASDTRLIDGAAQIIADANRHGIRVVELTNQSGIARGYYGWAEFEEVEREMTAQLVAQGARIDAAFACPHYPTHPARKPQPGMLLEAQRRLNIDLAASWIVGDHASDMLAGVNAGLRGGVHVTTGHGIEERKKLVDHEGFTLIRAESIQDAAQLWKGHLQLAV